MNLLIYSNSVSQRLHYILKFIFQEVIPCSYELTMDWNFFVEADAPKINYSYKACENSFQIVPHAILFEEDIHKQQVDCFQWQGLTAFFRTANQDLPFDIFAASFYLISRYEEYYPTELDEFYRFPHIQSLAYQQDFLNLPLVDLWADELKKNLQLRFPKLIFNQNNFRFTPTYDIDIAYSYRGKGFQRNIGGAIKDFIQLHWAALVKRFAVLAQLSKDPFDSYAFLDNIHQEFELEPIYFFLMGKGGKLDKNLPPHAPLMSKLIAETVKKYAIGIHPSYHSHDDTAELKSEIEQLSHISSNPVTKSRQHYIRFILPNTYQQLISLGIFEDYSMGYGSINGFRASTSNSFQWFDLSKNEPTNLRVYPFCFMECNSFYEQKQSVAITRNELQHYIAQVKKVNGHLITIWHNFSLGTDPLWHSWQSLYREQLAMIKA